VCTTLHNLLGGRPPGLRASAPLGGPARAPSLAHCVLNLLQRQSLRATRGLAPTADRQAGGREQSKHICTAAYSRGPLCMAAQDVFQQLSWAPLGAVAGLIEGFCSGSR